MERLVCILVGYILGCIQTSYIVGRIKYKIDVRNYGSGNAGSTNAIRVMGAKTGLLCMLGDILKGALTVLVCGLIFGWDQKYLLLYGGVGALLGHIYPFYMGFRGGKGVAVTIGMVALFDWRVMLLAGIPALMCLYLGRLMSLASLMFLTGFPVACFVYYGGTPHGMEIILWALFFTVMIFWRHRSNILRLKNGTERRIGDKSEQIHSSVPKENKKEGEK